MGRIIEMILISNETIEIVGMPKLSLPIKKSVSLMRSVALKSFHYRREGEPRKRLKEKVSMIGHDHPRAKIVSDTVKHAQ